jgi:mono/diheme cytochrome c family protein
MAASRRFFLALSCALLTAAASASAADQPASRDDSAAAAFFEKKVRPVLADNCYTCHSADTNTKGGLRLDDRNGMIHGGGRGPAIVPGHPEKSLLLQAVAHTHDKLKMPPNKHLSPEQIADLTKWIKDGAAWPRVQIPFSLGKPKAKYDRLRKTWWAWQPIRETKAPAVKDASWPRGEIDRYILATLEQKGLKPVRDSDRLTLIRRVTFDLIGLPPTLVEIDHFIKETSAGAFEKVVDRLLASPAFGERWGRHWLDVSRYGESTGPSRNVPFPHAWRYRDYVIDAFNKDKPYNRFVQEQIAGDLLPARSQQERDEQRIATGFLALGVKDVNQRFKVRFIMDNIDEQIDTVGRAVLALTVSCARCHDHKFDPIPTTDYYALAGIFHSSDLCAGVRNKMGGGGMDYYVPQMLLYLGAGPPKDPTAPAKIKELKKVLEQARKDFDALRNKPEGNALGPDGKPKRVSAQQEVQKLQEELFSLTDPATNAQVALGVREANTVGDTEIRIRGEAEKLGPVVPRGFLSVLSVPNVQKVNAKQSGRLELAQWLTSAKNPLTQRVIVNRIWHHLFGQGLVGSVDNFGVTGDKPSHPELLDHLARRFVEDGWSIKKLVRAVVLSRAYQLSAEAPAELLAVDPDNRLVWRHSPRRLEAEEIRDAMLAAGGNLNRTRPLASVAKKLKVKEMQNNGPEAKLLSGAVLASTHRSIYLPLVRGVVPTALEVFDFAEQGMVTGRRDTTTVAPQALYLLNDPFVRRQSLLLANRLLRRTDLNDDRRINLAYRLAMGRPATSREIERVKDYLAEYEAAARQIKPLPPKPPAKKPNNNAGQQAKQANPPAQQPPPRSIDPRTAAWASFCQVMLASAEFRYLQ